MALGLDPVTHKAPDLDIDARMSKRYGESLSMGARRERQAVAFVLDFLQVRGFKPTGEVLDGFGYEPSGPTNGNTKDTMEAVFDLDEARVEFVDPTGREVGQVYFVRGNEPEEVVSDWSWKKADGEGPGTFTHAVQEACDLLWGKA